MVWAGNRPFSTIAGFHWDEDQSGDFFQQQLIFHYNEDQSGDNVELLRQLALRLASLGCLVVAVDIDGETNKATVEDIQVAEIVAVVIFLMVIVYCLKNRLEENS